MTEQEEKAWEELVAWAKAPGRKGYPMPMSNAILAADSRIKQLENSEIVRTERSRPPPQGGEGGVMRVPKQCHCGDMKVKGHRCILTPEEMVARNTCPSCASFRRKLDREKLAQNISDSIIIGYTATQLEYDIADAIIKYFEEG
jgi:hypothetical protein